MMAFTTKPALTKATTASSFKIAAGDEPSPMNRTYLSVDYYKAMADKPQK